jgi:hypothetical protein
VRRIPHGALGWTAATGELNPRTAKSMACGPIAGQNG